MVDFILKLLDVDDFVGRSKNIDFAKGSHKLPMSVKEAWKQHKRNKAWQ